MKVRKWDEIMPLGPSLCALCIGNEDYSDKKLTNCARDAQRVADEVRKLPADLNAEAELRRNVKDKAGMEKALRDFLAKYAGRPPRTLLLYFSGHGIQTGDTLFLLPTSAALEGKELKELKEQCLSHDDVYRIIQEWLAKERVEDVLCIVVIDACRTALDGSEITAPFPSTLEPSGTGRPNAWVLCVASARGKVALASTSASSDLSAFTFHFISEECGLFQPNVPIRSALELICERVRQCERQDPTILGLEKIPSDLSFWPRNMPADSCEDFDVCLCYRHDTDHSLAKQIQDQLRLMGADKVFFEAERGGAPRDDQIANALRNSKIIALVISKKTFEGIEDFAKGEGKEGMKRLFWQYEMALEIYEHSIEGRARIWPIFCGDEKDANRFGAIGCDPHEWQAGFDSAPGNKDPFWQLRRKALRLLREDQAMARMLHNKNLSRISAGNVAGTPSLIKGRKAKDTMAAILSFQESRLQDIPKDTAVRELVTEMVSVLGYEIRGTPRAAKRPRTLGTESSIDSSEGAASSPSCSSPRKAEVRTGQEFSLTSSPGVKNFRCPAALSSAASAFGGPELAPGCNASSAMERDAARETWKATGGRLNVECGVTKIEVRWDLCGMEMEEEEEDVWWPATIMSFQWFNDGNWPVWKIKYDPQGRAQSDLDSSVSFRNSSTLSDECLSIQNEKEAKSGASFLQWRLSVGEQGSAEEPHGRAGDAESLLKVGTVVKAKWRRGDEWYAGRVWGIQDNGTYMIKYEDGDFDLSLERRYIKPDETEETAVAHRLDEFVYMFAVIFVGSPRFRSLSFQQQHQAARDFNEMRQLLEHELESYREQRGRGAPVTGDFIWQIIEKYKETRRMPGVSGTGAAATSTVPVRREELVQGQSWRVEGHHYLESRTLRTIKDVSHNGVSKSIAGTIKGWISLEDSMSASEEDRYEDARGEAIAMWRNVHENGDGEDLEEHEVEQAIDAWLEYQGAVNRTKDMCGVEVKSGITQLEIFDHRAWDARGEERWMRATLGDVDHFSSDLDFSSECPVWVLRYETGAETKVALVAPNSMYDLGEATGQISDERSTVSWRQCGEEYLPQEVEAVTRPLQRVLASIELQSALDTLIKLVTNCVKEPHNERFRKLRLSNEKIKDLVNDKGARDALLALGWVFEEEHLVLPLRITLTRAQLQEVERAKAQAGRMPL